MTTLAVTPSPELNQLKITLTPEAEAKKANALAAAEFIMAVANPAEQQAAIAAAADLKRFAKDIEAAREDVKRPFLEAGRAIDRAAKLAADSVASEVRRLEALVGDYQRKEQEKADAIRREQEAIAREIEQKRLAAEREKLRLEQEALRREQEALRLAQEAKSKKDREAAAALAAKLEEERLQREFAEPEPTPPPIVLPPAPLPPKAEGAAVRPEYEYEIEPQGLQKLYAAYGTRFVKLEIDRAAVRYFLNGAKEPVLPGLIIRATTRVSVRAAR